jgi:hypothetical protein
MSRSLPGRNSTRQTGRPKPAQRSQPQPNSDKILPAATLRMRVADQSENPLSICPRRAGPAASVALVPSPTRFQSGYLGFGFLGQSPIADPPGYLLDLAAGDSPPLFSSASLHTLPLWRFADIRRTGFAPKDFSDAHLQLPQLFVAHAFQIQRFTPLRCSCHFFPIPHCSNSKTRYVVIETFCQLPF